MNDKQNLETSEMSVAQVLDLALAATLEASGLCSNALESLKSDDLREQIEAARAHLRDAADSLGWVAMNAEEDDR